ncbi:sodium:proton antiporter [Rubrobacter marinus]|uniref:Sodium:proton antiporter n=1 Tax=Rubrobacter marinus TaxID=2653852 RepID=A0A6G8PYQ2_9ACTN|nr:monovalent cation/H(+) antiporter subunit G [Rubrobacter marinus]QIN79343.1 sodium:proton antiporter [Rubrobacter marinus]
MREAFGALGAAFSAVAPWVADVLVVLGIFGMTVGIYGIVRMPDVYNKLHAASKVVFLGVVMLLLASAVTNDAAIIMRAALIGIFLVLTTPVSAHVVGKAAFLRGYEMETPDAVDESGRGLGKGPEDDRSAA